MYSQTIRMGLSKKVTVYLHKKTGCVDYPTSTANSWLECIKIVAMYEKRTIFECSLKCKEPDFFPFEMQSGKKSEVSTKPSATGRQHMPLPAAEHSMILGMLVMVLAPIVLA